MVIAVTLLAGCSVSDAFRDATSIDYKSASRGPALDIPPDLVTPRGDDRFAIPDRPSTGTTFSTYSRDRAEAPQRAASGPVVMPQPPGVRLERQGAQRWLVIDQPPERVWPVVRDFWSQSGFALRTESPETGIMGGAENAVTLITADGSETWPRMAKSDVAGRLAARMAKALA
jgi:outer membrane protein assembly factor BamC